MAICKEFMQFLCKQVCDMKDVGSVAALLQTSPLLLMRLRFDKPYFVFEVRKKKASNG